MTATDTQKNTVYVIAKRMQKRCTIEQYATALAQHFIHTYPRVSQCLVQAAARTAGGSTWLDGRSNLVCWGYSYSQLSTDSADGACQSLSNGI